MSELPSQHQPTDLIISADFCRTGEGGERFRGEDSGVILVEDPKVINYVIRQLRTQHGIDVPRWT